MTALHPLALLLVPALAVLVVVGHHRREARRTRLRQALDAGPVPGPHRLQLMAGAVGAVALGAALSAPSLGKPAAGRVTSEATVVLAVDVSRSMSVRDVAPDRMARARMAALRIASESGARVGLVVFANDASALLPPTDDGGLVALYLEALDPDITSGEGSHLAAGVDKAVALVGADTTRMRHVVVLTDGESFDEGSELLQAGRRAEAMGVRVHGLVVGTSEGGAVPGIPGSHSAAGGQSLRDVARMTDGSVSLADGDGVSRFIRTLRAPSPGPAPEGAVRPIVDLTSLLAALALLGITLEWGAEALRRRMAW